MLILSLNYLVVGLNFGLLFKTYLQVLLFRHIRHRIHLVTVEQDDFIAKLFNANFLDFVDLCQRMENIVEDLFDKKIGYICLGFFYLQKFAGSHT